MSINDKELNVGHTLEDLMAVTKFFKISAMYSTGGDTAERTYKTAELYICKSELSLSSDIRRISGLGRRSDYLQSYSWAGLTSLERRMGKLSMLVHRALKPKSIEELQPDIGSFEERQN